MRNNIPRMFTLALVAMIIGSFSLGVMLAEAGSRSSAFGVIAKSRADGGKRDRGPKIPRSDIRCTPPESPAYDGEKLTCGEITDPPLPAGAGSYIIAPEGIIEADIWGLPHLYTIVGGTLNSRTGEGIIELSNGQTMEIIFAYRDPEFLALTVKFAIFNAAETEYSGLMDASATGSNVYDGDLVDVFGNELTFDLPGLRIFPE